MFVALAALLWANSPWAQTYFDLWQHELRFSIGSWYVFSHGGHPFSILNFINDALMAVFFFLTALEIKREALVGELSSVRQASLPILAACGGMIVPVAVFYFVARGTPAEAGIAVPMATDIAFSLGVLSLFGKRVPLSLKIFLTTFAVADDIGGILVIAFFYTSHLSWFHLLLAAGVLAILWVGNWRGIHTRWFYLGFGLVLWYLFLQGGIHATIAGVILAFTIPATPSLRKRREMQAKCETTCEILPEATPATAPATVRSTVRTEEDCANSPLQTLTTLLTLPVAYLIMPIFAFANAGVAILRPDGGIEFGEASLGIILGLVVGKFVGIYLFTVFALKYKLANLPTGMTYKNLTGICMLGGVGFTVALFIAQLSFADPNLLAQAKIGVVGGTAIAGLLGYILLNATLPKLPKSSKQAK